MSRFKNVEINNIFMELDASVKCEKQKEYLFCLLSLADEKISTIFAKYSFFFNFPVILRSVSKYHRTAYEKP
jgi:hypothetical protein